MRMKKQRYPSPERMMKMDESHISENGVADIVAYLGALGITDVCFARHRAKKNVDLILFRQPAFNQILAVGIPRYNDQPWWNFGNLEVCDYANKNEFVVGYIWGTEKSPTDALSKFLSLAADEFLLNQFVLEKFRYRYGDEVLEERLFHDHISMDYTSDNLQRFAQDAGYTLEAIQDGGQYGG